MCCGKPAKKSGRTPSRSGKITRSSKVKNQIASLNKAPNEQQQPPQNKQ